MAEPRPPRAPPGRRSHYVRFHTLSTRWLDNDAYGHVNNAVYYAWIDTAVNAVLIGEAALDIAKSDSIGLVVESGCRYHAPAVFPDVIHAGVRVTAVGGSSVRYEVGLFRNDEEEAAAEGFFVHVYVDRCSRRPAPLSEPLRRLVTALTPPAAERHAGRGLERS